MRNAASPEPGVYGQGGAEDGYWSPISVQAAECSSLGLILVAGASHNKRPRCVGQLMIGMSVVRRPGEAYRLSEDKYRMATNIS